ncbi:MAG: hypothetical protein WCX77_03000, partial [Candidatus Paceibacterota bacterium]
AASAANLIRNYAASAANLIRNYAASAANLIRNYAASAANLKLIIKYKKNKRKKSPQWRFFGLIKI